MNEGAKRIYSEMEKLFLKKPKYAEPNSSVLLVLENNILNRNIRTIDSIKGKFSEEVFDKLSQDDSFIAKTKIIFYKLKNIKVKLFLMLSKH